MPKYDFTIAYLKKHLRDNKKELKDNSQIDNDMYLKHLEDLITELQSAIEFLQTEANKPANIKGYHDVNDFYENSEFYDDRDLQKEGEK